MNWFSATGTAALGATASAAVRVSRWMAVRAARLLTMVMMGALVGGCSTVVLGPAGDVAMRERNLILASTALMLVIIFPVMMATLIFAWRYRATNTDAKYDPDFHHSTRLEVLIWTAPLMIIIALGALTWIGTHILDPYRTLRRISPGEIVASDQRPLTVEVVALDWKWLFFYPDQGIATINELAAPLNVPINFRITSSTVMNTFFVPALAGQIYAMAGMETKLHAVANRTGTFDGFSGNYSGAGFSGMHFKFHSLAQSDFDAWVAKVKAPGELLDQARFSDLEKPSEAEQVHYFSTVQPDLYDKILNLCARPETMCLNEMMHIDATGGAGKDSDDNRGKLVYDGHRMQEGTEEPGATFPASGRPPNTNVQPQGMKPRPLSPDVNGKGTDQKNGQGMPGMDMQSPAPAQLQKN